LAKIEREFEVAEIRRVTQAEAAGLLYSSGGRMVTVTFNKRGNGEERTITGRRGVTKHLVGGVLNYNPMKHGLIGIYEMGHEDGKGYRMINALGITQLKIERDVFEVVPNV
jgi:hypothetical protein